MVDSNQLDAIEIRHLAEFLADPDFVLTVAGHHSLTRHLNILVVVHRKVIAVSGAGAERRYAENICQKAEARPIPREYHRARTGQPLCLFVSGSFACGLM